MTRQSFGFLGFAVLFLFSTTVVSGQEMNSEKTSWEDYRVISERNIFSRNRRQSNQSVFTEAQKRPAIVQKEQSYYILRGITRQADGFVSFIEDSRTMEIGKFRKGEMIGKGRLKNITLDYISYELEGGTIRVEIGMNLEGRPSSTASQYFPQFEAPSEGPFEVSSRVQTDAQAPAQDEKAGDILKRLRERRKKELEE